MSFDNNSFYDDNSTKNWQPQPTPMEDRRRRHTGKWVTAILILGLLALAVTGTVHLVRDVGVTINRSDTGFLLTVGTQPAQTAPTEQTQTAKETEPSVQAEAPAQTQQAAEELPQLTITQSPAGVPTVASDEAGALSLQEIYRRCIGSVVSIVTVTPSGKASGTGIIMSEDGYVITNHHVIESAQAVSVLTADSREYTASVIGSDETSDLAVLKIEAEGLQAAEFGDSSVLQVGDSVAAIGDPLGTALRGTMTDGIVSAINRDLTVNDRTMSLIQTNAALNNGNSGGPLINCYGQVIGINTMKMSNFYSSSTTVEGIGFAIPIDTAKPIIDELIEKGYVSGHRHRRRDAPRDVPHLLPAAAGHLCDARLPQQRRCRQGHFRGRHHHRHQRCLRHDDGAAQPRQEPVHCRPDHHADHLPRRRFLRRGDHSHGPRKRIIAQNTPTALPAPWALHSVEEALFSYFAQDF